MYLYNIYIGVAYFKLTMSDMNTRIYIDYINEMCCFGLYTHRLCEMYGGRMILHFRFTVSGRQFSFFIVVSFFYGLSRCSDDAMMTFNRSLDEQYCNCLSFSDIHYRNIEKQIYV